jgi:hypothetical protein
MRKRKFVQPGALVVYFPKFQHAYANVQQAIKMNYKILAVGLLALGVVSAGAADVPAKKAAPAKPKAVKTIVVRAVRPSTESTNKVEITGSYIKRQVNRNGRATDGPSNVLIIDSTDIHRTGGADLAAVLSRVRHR